MSTGTKLMATSPVEDVVVGASSDQSVRGEGGGLQITLLTGGFDKPYAYGISMALAASRVQLDVVGSDDVDSPEMHSSSEITFLNWQKGWQSDGGLLAKIIRLLGFYVRLILYAAGAKSRIFHILWNNKFVYFDRTLLMLYFRLLRKRIILTAHNVNTAKRDQTDTWINRLTLKAQYRLADGIFVHTQKMRAELISEFGVRPEAVTVIPFGINNAAVHTALTSAEAKRKLHIGASERTVLFFGRIQPYKGLEYLVEAFESLSAAEAGPQFRLIIAGAPKKEHEAYWLDLRHRIERGALRDRVLLAIRYISDEETEVYFKAADALVLPYTDIYQSGVLSLGYSFGLPIIATDVGVFREEIIEGETGLICKPADPADLAFAIKRYFASSMYADLNNIRTKIQAYALQRYSWNLVADITLRTYQQIRR
jgi:glycosyltransferase involved in cell wall biosynthesis